MTELTLHVPNVYNLDVNKAECYSEDPHTARSAQLEFKVAENVAQLNIGVLAYTIRERPGRAVKYYIDPSSLRLARLPALRNWINSLEEKHAYHLRPASIYEEGKKFSSMIFWCDTHGYERVLDSVEDFHEALVAYSDFLCAKIEPGGPGNYTNRMLTIAAIVGRTIFDADSYNLNVGVKFPGHNKSEQISTPAPSEEHLIPVYRTVNDVFRSIYDFLMGDRSSPALFECHDERYWITPCYYPFISETAIFEHQGYHTPGKILNAVKERALGMVSKSDGELTFSDAVSEVMSELARGLEIPDATITSRSMVLRKNFTQKEIHKLAIIAHDCFVFMILLNTGSNAAPLGQIEWGPGSTIEAEVQRMRSIKHRAGSQVEIIFGARFLRRFREFIEIRKELPGVDKFDRLFGTFYHGRPAELLSYNLSNKLSIRLRRLVNPDLGSIGFRELRAYHHQKKSSQSGFDVAANSAQHTLATALANYSTGNIQENIDQTVMYFTAFGEAATEFSDQLTQTGGCSGGLIEAVAIEDAVITPDCKNLMGCLFCEHYLLHFNADDVRKLLSVEYVIEQLRQVQFNSDEFSYVYGPTLARISWFLKTVAEYSPALHVIVNDVRKDVFDKENLNSYWQKKLNILVSIGVL